MAAVTRIATGKKALFLALLGLLICGCGGRSTEDWIEALRSKDAAERLHAVKALGERRAQAAEVVPALTAALQDDDAFVRRDAALALGEIGASAKPAVPGLLGGLRDRNAHVRLEAAKALKRIDPQAAAQAGVQ